MRNMCNLERKADPGQLRFAFFVSLCFSAGVTVATHKLVGFALDSFNAGLIAGAGAFLFAMLACRFMVTGMTPDPS